MSSSFSSTRSLLVFLLLLLGITEVGAQGASFRYFRFNGGVGAAFNGWTIRDNTEQFAEGPQLSEIEWYLGTTRVTGNPSITVTTSSTGPGPSEQPPNLVDNNVTSKWYDKENGELIFDFGEVVSVDRFRFGTADDVPGRDPVGWTLEGSNDQVDWVIVDQRTSLTADQIPMTRETIGTEIIMNQVNLPPVVTFTITAGNLTSNSAVGISSGEQITLDWNAGTATSVTLDTGAGPQAVNAMDTLNISPTATQTFTLSATNLGGTTQAQVTAFVGISEMNPQISEFLAEGSLGGVLCDKDGDPSDWIEIFNPNDFAISLAGRFLTVDPSKVNRWAFPAGTSIDAQSYLVVFASNKPASAPELRTDFTLGTAPQYLALLNTNGSTVLDAYANYPQQETDISYGRVPAGSFNIFTEPTPGSANITPPGPLGPEVTFLTPSGTFTGSTSVSMSTSSATATIYYTIDGSIPTQSSIRYSSANPQFINGSTLVRARTFETGFAPGPIATQAFIQLNSAVAAQKRDLPVIVIENFNGGAIGTSPQFQSTYFSLFEPDESGETDLTSPPTRTSRLGLRRREGSSGLKPSYRLNFWQDGSDEPRPVDLFGFSEDHDWVLYAPYQFDVSLIRTPFIYQLANDAGFKVPRTRLVEVYLNTSGDVNFGAGGNDSANDYQGVYVLMERPGQSEERIDVDRLNKNDNDGDELTGGYILRIDRTKPGEAGFRTTLGHPMFVAGAGAAPFFNYESPGESEITDAQKNYILGYLDSFETALFDANDNTDWREFFDEEAAIDHSIFSVLIQNPDALRLSTFLYKPHNGKLHFGPIWDIERGMSASNERRSWFQDRWLPDVDRADFFEYEYWNELFNDLDFAQLWIDRWHELRQGELSNAAMNARIDALAAKVDPVQAGNFTRWPVHTPANQNSRDAGRDFSGEAGGTFTWAGEVEHLKGFMTRHADWIDGKLNRLPILQAGGVVTAGSTITLQSTDGGAWYTTNGEDPRLPGGGVNPNATEIIGPGTITINGAATVWARSRSSSSAGKFNSEWSGSVKSTFITSGTPAAAGSLVLSEIMYHPMAPSASEISGGFTSADDFEYLELQNVSLGTINLSGVIISRAIKYEFPNGFTVPSGGVILLVRNQAAFQARYGNGITIAGEWGSEEDLADAGERIIVTGIDGQTIADFTYDDARNNGWPQAADGAGQSLTVDLPFMALDPALSSTWRDSVSANGSPGVGFNNFCDEWKAFFFPTNMNAGNLDDPDGDGSNNLLELGLGQNPIVADTPPLIDARIEDLTIGGNTDPYFTVTFIRRRNVSGLQVQAGFSNTMEDAFSEAGILIRARDLGNGNEEVTYRDVAPSTGAKRFARVEVTK